MSKEIKSSKLLDPPFHGWDWDIKDSNFRWQDPEKTVQTISTEINGDNGLKEILSEKDFNSLGKSIQLEAKEKDFVHFQICTQTKAGLAEHLIFHGFVNQRNDSGDALSIKGFCRASLMPETEEEFGLKSELDYRWKLEDFLIKSQRFEGIGKLAGGIAHDLNNLLAPIRMATELLSRKISDEGLGKYVDIIQNSTDRARAVIDQVLSFAKNSGSNEIKFVYVNPVLEELDVLVKETFPKSIKTKLDFGSKIPAIAIDPNKLHQALLNILINARDAMNGIGEIQIKTSFTEFDIRMKVGTKFIKPGTYAKIEISDTGEGIDPKILDDIFDPFFTTKGKEQGTGLGLATVFSIISDAGGFVDVSSTLGEGSTFTIYLPEYEKILVDEEDFKTESTEELIGKTIVVIDDEENILKVLATHLRGWKMEVIAFASPRKALQYLTNQNSPPDIIMIDIHMPDLNGVQLISQIIDNVDSRKVLICTGDIGFNSQELPESVSKSSIIYKPFKPSELVSGMLQCLKHSSE